MDRDFVHAALDDFAKAQIIASRMNANAGDIEVDGPAREFCLECGGDIDREENEGVNLDKDGNDWLCNDCAHVCPKCGTQHGDENASTEAMDDFYCDKCWQAKASELDLCVECGDHSWPVCADCGYVD